MFENLWSKVGMDRLAEIDDLKLSEYDYICKYSRRCSECPLAILYDDVNGFSRLMCVDVATRSRVLNALSEGGRFLRKGEKLSDEA